MIGLEFLGLLFHLLNVQFFKIFVWIYKHFSPFCRTSLKNEPVTKVFENQINIVL